MTVKIGGIGGIGGIWGIVQRQSDAPNKSGVDCIELSCTGFLYVIYFSICTRFKKKLSLWVQIIVQNCF